MLSAAYVLLQRHGGDLGEVAKFWHQVYTGAGLQEGSAALGLRDRLTRYRGSLTSAYGRNDEQLELIIRYWNGWVGGAGGVRYNGGYIKSTGKFPEIRRA